MTGEEKEMWEWLNQEVCSKCGINSLPKDSPYYHCDRCRGEVKNTIGEIAEKFNLEWDEIMEAKKNIEID